MNIQTEVEIGTQICIALKRIYFAAIPWPKCYMQVANKFTHLKQIAYKFYSDKTRDEIFQELRRFSDNDIRDVFEYGKDIPLELGKKYTNQEEKPKYDKNVTWVPIPVGKMVLRNKIRQLLVANDVVISDLNESIEHDEAI